MSELRRPIGRLLTGATVEWDAVERALRRRQRRRVVAWALAPAVAAAAALLLVARPRPTAPAALTLADGRPLLAGTTLPAGAVLRLSDRSRVALSEGASLTLTRHAPTAVEFTLRAGHASFEVTPGGPRRWRVDCGLATVTVVGTGFDLDLDPARLTVSVRHGAVRVAGARVAGASQLLRAGASLAVWATPPTPPMLIAPAQVLVDAGVAGHGRPAAAAGPARRPTVAVARAHVDASTPDAPPRVVADAAVVDPAEALWLRADGARRARRYADAAALLVTLVDEHPGSARAPMAAFLVGRDRLRALRQPALAAEAFDRAIELGLADGLREEAWLGLVESRWQSGDRAGARSAAGVYRTMYPRGAHRGYIDSLVGAAP